MFDMMEATRLEKLHLAYDPATGLRAVIAIHSTRLGPALGGCRYLPYPNDEAALRDAARLAQGMSYKAALAGLRQGGGKAVILRAPHVDNRGALFEAVYSEQVDQLLAPADDPSAAPGAALDAWLRRFVEFIIGKRAFAEEMAHDTEIVYAARRRIYGTAEPLLAAAQEAGEARTDVTADDVLRMLSGIGLADYPQDGQLERVIGVCLDGLRPRS